MEKLGWKITAIVFICLFVGLAALNVWAVSWALEDDAKINDCYYNICEEYPDAWYEAGVCSCYDYNEYGEAFVTKTKYNN